MRLLVHREVHAHQLGTTALSNEKLNTQYIIVRPDTFVDYAVKTVALLFLRTAPRRVPHGIKFASSDSLYKAEMRTMYS
jgi:hypothetical protein